VASESSDSGKERQERLLLALEKLLELPGAELVPTMTQVSDLLNELLQAEKTDVFFLDPATQTLVSLGVSETPLGRKQKRLGLDRLQLANGGRVVQVFETGKSWHTSHQDEDPEELPGVKYGLHVRSAIAAPIHVGGERRGVLECSSTQPGCFAPEDLRFLEATARWVGMVAHRVELVEERTKAIAAQARRAAAEELITVFAHDMGNHLVSLRMRIELLHQRALRKKTAEDIRDSEAAARSVAALTQLTSDLLDVGRLEQGLFSLRVQPVDVVRLVREVAVTATTPDNDVHYRGPEELLLFVDPDRLRQALANLVANALKHSPEGLPVVVEVAKQPRTDGNWVILSVTDQGPGVAPQVLPHLFERFTRGPASKGLGLGLYLAREIAQAHGGTLEVQSTPGKGARFELALPLFEDDSDG
jgi:signal transduction histidine kinase